MPAQFTMQAADVSALMRELRDAEPNLVKEFRAELKKDLLPFAKGLKDKVPAQSPLSGFARGTARQNRYTWAPMLASVKAPLARRAKKPGVFPVVSMSFRGSRKSAGVWILEMAREGRTPQGVAMVRNLNARAPVREGLGRFILPEAKKNQGQVTDAAKRVVEKFMQKVGRRLK